MSPAPSMDTTCKARSGRGNQNRRQQQAEEYAGLSHAGTLADEKR